MIASGRALNQKISSRPPRTWGFRFSRTDVLIIAGGALTTGVLWKTGSSLTWLPLTVLGHFFLFCNVFRIIRWRELLWSGGFIANVSFWMVLGQPDWKFILLTQFPLTLVAIVSEMLSARYHGIFADRVNKKLETYLRGDI